ncbi:MAG: PEP-CTERM sorting domain-containing protein [Rubripirellula sp.]
MRSKIFFCVAWVPLLLVADASRVVAAPVTTIFTATVNQIVADSTNLTQIGGINLGDTLTGTMIFDPDVASADLDNDIDRGFFNHTLASGLVLDYQVAGLSFPGGPFASFTIENDIASALSDNTDALFVASGSTGFPANFVANQTFIELIAADETGQVFGPNEGFITQFDLNDYDVAFANIFLNGAVNIDGQAFTNVAIGSTVQISAVPEPSSFVAIALLGVAATGRFRRRRVI